MKKKKEDLKNKKNKEKIIINLLVDNFFKYRFLKINKIKKL